MANLNTLPTELQLLIKSHLDPIDATCFALTSPNLYNTSINTIPTTSLTTPTSSIPKPLSTPLNFRPRPVLSRTPSSNNTPTISGTATPSNEKTQFFTLEIPHICRHCRSTRCSLHNHIAGFVGPDYEFCAVSAKFVRTVSADDDAVSDDGSVASSSDGAVTDARHRSCWRSCPPRPGVCGRHG